MSLSKMSTPFTTKAAAAAAPAPAPAPAPALGAAASATMHPNTPPTTGNPEIGISLCIPRIFNNISWRKIKEVIIACGWGYVERVDVIHKGSHKRAFIHFKAGGWNTRNAEAMKILKAFQEGKTVTVLYDDPWYWKISLSRSHKPAEQPEPRRRPAVAIGGKPRIKRRRNPAARKIKLNLTEPTTAHNGACDEGCCRS